MRITGFVLAIVLLASASCGRRVRTVTVAQSGKADVIGNDRAALQRAADLLRTGDTLSIGPGVYEMDNSLFVRSGVTVRGVAGQTVLRKSRGIESVVQDGGEYGERLLLVAEPDKFHAGMGISIQDDTGRSCWGVSVSTVAAVNGHGLEIHPTTLRDYSGERRHAVVRNTFPVLAVMDAENVVIDGLVVDGNRAENAYLNGCRGGAIYMYRVRNVTVRNCVARDYNGDGISFQISEDVHVLNCRSYGHAGLGIHPGTGSNRAVVKSCHMHNNGDIGLFLCWRVRHGQFSDNVIEDNGHYGISIGHKDTDNEFTNNTIARNGVSGVYFRQESFPDSGHRNVFRKNKILDNGDAHAGYGICIMPHAGEIVVEDNQIAETRSENRTQRYGIYKVEGAGPIHLQNNTMAGHTRGDYFEAAALPADSTK